MEEKPKRRAGEVRGGVRRRPGNRPKADQWSTEDTSRDEEQDPGRKPGTAVI